MSSRRERDPRAEGGGAPPDDAARVRRIRESPSFRRADRDLEFLARDDVRATRLELEYLKPELLLREQGVASTVVVFGSTRIVAPAAASAALAEARRALAAEPDAPERRAAARSAERDVERSRFYEVAREFARIASKAGRSDDVADFVITTGGGPGIMEAANRGALDAGCKTVGLRIALPFDQDPNPYITPDLCFEFRYFALRKMHFLQRARALVAFPGGYGTLDEIFDALCLMQTRKTPLLPVVLVGEEYWRRVFDADFLVEEGMIDPADRELFRYAETAGEIWAHIDSWWRNRLSR